MTEAIFGLLGVIVGGLITAGTQFVTRRWETRASDAWRFVSSVAS